MKHLRMLAIAAILLIAVSSSGCLMWTWTYDFTASDAAIEDWYSNYGSYEFVDDGLTMSHMSLTTPVYFIGDFTMTAVFVLDVDEDNHARLEIGLGDGINWSFDNGFYVDLWCLGSTENEGWLIEEWDHDNYVYYQEQGPIGPIYYQGENVIKLAKCGSTFTFFLNGVKMYTMVAKYADMNETFVTIWSGQGELGRLTYKRIEVKYEGISDPWPII